MKKRKISWLLILAFTITVLVWISFHFNPELVKEYYTNPIFGTFRRLMGRFSILSMSCFWILMVFIYVKRFRIKAKYASSFIQWFFKYLSPVLWLIIIFYWLWGFNYQAVKPELYLIIDKNNSGILANEYFEAFHNSTITINEIREMLSTQLDTLQNIEQATANYKHWQMELQSVLQKLNYNIAGTPNYIYFKPKGFLLRLGTAGFFNFIIGRPTLDPGLHPVQIPSIVLHELTHVYGIGDEGSANFLAWMVGSASSDPLLRYSVELGLWQSLHRQCKMLDSLQARTIANLISTPIKSDIENIRFEMDKYPDFAPQLRDQFYGLFLKSQGIEEGMGSYDRYLDLVMKYKRAQK